MIKISKERILQIKTLRHKNYSWRKIGKEMDISHQTARVYGSGYCSIRKYEEHLAKRKNLTHSQYFKHMALRNGSCSFSDYRRKLENKRGFSSHTEYVKYFQHKNQKKPEFRALVYFIKNGLRNFNKTQYWLARKLGVKQQTISLWQNGKLMPNEERAEKLFLLLAANCNSLEYFVD